MVADPSLLLQGGFFIVLLTAVSAWDICKRIIPDMLCLCIALTALLDFTPEKLLGLIPSLALLSAALLWGGMGGGDIKLMAASGLVLGFYNGMTALVAGLILLLLFHALCFITQKLRRRTVPRAYPLAPFLSIGCLAAYFLF